MASSSPLFQFRGLLRSFRDALAVLDSFDPSYSDLILQCDNLGRFLLSPSSLDSVPPCAEEQSLLASCRSLCVNLSFNFDGLITTLSALFAALQPPLSIACTAMISDFRAKRDPAVYWDFFSCHASDLDRLQLKEIEYHLAVCQVYRTATSLADGRSLGKDSPAPTQQLSEQARQALRQARELSSRWTRFQDSIDARLERSEAAVRQIYEKQPLVATLQQGVTDATLIKFMESDQRLSRARLDLQAIRETIEAEIASRAAANRDLAALRSRLSNLRRLSARA
jgi:hypothetical protein